MASSNSARQSLPGLVLLAAAALGLIVANSPLAHLYESLLTAKIGPVLGPISLHKSVGHWINDGLMAVFFLLVGLELKRELRGGALSNPRDALLPALAAVGGMAVPALIYFAFNAGDPEAMRGWAIPAATDIAFALCILALAGDKVPVCLRVFLVSVAVVDDLGAILVIAAFYTESIAFVALAIAGGLTLGLIALNRAGVRHRLPYLMLGALLWLAVLKSGLHATLAGVVLALTIPHEWGGEDTMCTRLEHDLHPGVSFLILPIFGFANAGVPLAGVDASVLLGSVPVGIALALVIGKPIGIAGISWLAIKSGIAELPKGATWQGMLGASMAAGVGFTMSLFIGGLAFTAPEYTVGMRIGVIAGSLVSATAALVLLKALPSPSAKSAPAPTGAPA